MAKGGNGANSVVKRVIGIVLAIFLVSALGPSSFTQLTGFNASGIPTWLYTLLQVLVGFAFVYIIWRVVDE